MVNERPSFQLYACLIVLVGFFLCGCDENKKSFAAPQKVYSLSQSTISPSLTRITTNHSFWLKMVSPPQTAASGYIIVVNQEPPIVGVESILKWHSDFPITLYPELSDSSPVIFYDWKIYEIKRDDNGVFILIGVQEK